MNRTWNSITRAVKNEKLRLVRKSRSRSGGRVDGAANPINRFLGWLNRWDFVPVESTERSTMALLGHRDRIEDDFFLGKPGSDVAIDPRHCTEDADDKVGAEPLGDGKERVDNDRKVVVHSGNPTYGPPTEDVALRDGLVWLNAVFELNIVCGYGVEEVMGAGDEEFTTSDDDTDIGSSLDEQCFFGVLRRHASEHLFDTWEPNVFLDGRNCYARGINSITLGYSYQDKKFGSVPEASCVDSLPKSLPKTSSPPTTGGSGGGAKNPPAPSSDGGKNPSKGGGGGANNPPVSIAAHLARISEFRRHIYDLAKEKFGLPTMSNANRIIVRQWVYRAVQDFPEIRAKDRASVIDTITNLVFIPNEVDLEARAILMSRYARVRAGNYRKRCGDRWWWQRLGGWFRGEVLPELEFSN